MADRAPHIGIDARELVGSPTGVGRYAAEVIGRWAAGATDHRFTLFVHDAPPAWVSALDPRFDVVVERGRHAGTLWEQTRLPAAVRRARVDVLFSPAYTAPVRLSVPSVVAIHDVSFFAQPSGFRAREGLRRRVLTRWSARNAAAVATLSAFSANEIARWLGIPREAIVIAPPGAPVAHESLAPAPREPLVLYVGTMFNRRHVPELIAGFARARARCPDARLVLVGGNQTRPPIDIPALAAAAGVAGAVESRPYVGDAELADLYQRARAFVFLSDYEGFAMTPMEAIAHGAPGVLLDTAVAREVYGPDATLVTLDAADIGRAIGSLLTDSDAHRIALERDRRRLALFSWERTAGILLSTLDRAVNR